MHHYKRILAFLLVIMLSVNGVSIIWAAESVKAEPGMAVTLTFSFEDVYDVDGAFAINDPNKILKNHAFKIVSSGATSASVIGTRLRAEVKSEPVKTTVVVSLEGTLAETAEAGQSCTVTFNGTYGDGLKAYGKEYSTYQSATITVEAPVQSTDAQDGQSTVSGNAQGAAGQNDEGTSQKSENDMLAASRKVLEEQIKRAEAVDVTKYTKASGDALQKALKNGKAALKSSDYNKVDAAAVALKSAVGGMKKMNYDALKAALIEAEAILEIGELTDLGIQLEESMKMGSGLLTSRDQVAVDTAVSHLQEVMARIDKILGELKTPEVIEVEIPVEVPPTDDYCNIPIHKVWPMLLFLSAAMNVVLVALIVTYTVKKKKYQNDDTPLVEYDIEDDF